MSGFWVITSMVVVRLLLPLALTALLSGALRRLLA